MTRRGERPLVPILLVAALISTPLLLVTVMVVSALRLPPWIAVVHLGIVLVSTIGYGAMQLYDIECPRK